MNYIFACNKTWHIEFFLKNRHKLKGNWSIAASPSDLEEQVLRLKPRYIFFPHWSDIVPSRIFEKYECVCFHMTDLPYGRGGSPLQNLIINGHSKTMITAFKMNKEIDAGPVYLKHELDLAGSAFDIFLRSAPICFDMMLKIQLDEIVPTAQKGKPTLFKRRIPSDSEIPPTISIKKMYDFIRMLDAPAYPSAYFFYGNLKFEFSDAIVNEDHSLNAKVRVVKYEA